ncbi:hypothetical protein ASF79_00175 [Agreia sp. Leaf335]|uniref:DUF3618 domain-containing protein n=1 Tax=Agreia sp. Leaf335 TaxID=1736340 RepID=UPI00070181BA|nr:MULTISPECIES: DUF3618 domain-containing protein [Microbacteriaceae]KQR23724.1 hypothetical protein ASF79_00175 [Agreia sp. Leaf335]PPF62446.1 DUF3618 domain-containing protein [Clavibacter michiganensis]
MSDKKDAPVDGAAVRATTQMAKTALQGDGKPDAPQRSSAELAADIVKNREALASTLDAIEYKLNVPKQAKLAAADISNKIRVLRDENPVALAAGIGGIAVAVGGAVFLAVRLISRR